MTITKLNSVNDLTADQNPTLKEITPVVILKTVKTGLRREDTRSTFIVNERKLLKIKAIAYLERISIKQTVDCAFDLLINKFENVNGTVKINNK
jgi:Holliday junction resolvase-like predicted endonuclease